MFAHQPSVSEDFSDNNNDIQGSEFSPQSEGKKRIACAICRKRKLRCDGATPSCERCTRIGHQCSYQEGRKQIGPRRGYVRGLESRLGQFFLLLLSLAIVMFYTTYRSAGDVAQVETLLKTRETNESDATMPSIETLDPVWSSTQLGEQASEASFDPNNLFSPGLLGVPDHFDDSSRTSTNPLFDDPQNDPMCWQILELGLNEPLPLQEVLEELTEIYFEKVHPSVPMIHRYRFMAAMSLSPQARPPIALRYAMWSLAASVTPKYKGLQEHFYKRARKYAESVEELSHGEKTQSLANTQAEILIGLYEFKTMHFPRAWLRTGRVVRLAQMICLHRLDLDGMYVTECFAPARDWIEKEERRRTFWMTFCMDRYATTGSGWPMIIDERDILTNLPSSEEAFQHGLETQEMSLGEAMNPSKAASLSQFAGVIVVTSIFGRALTHLHRPGPDDRDDDLNGDFWKRHRSLDNTLLTTCLYLPPQLRLPSVSPTSSVVFLNMCLHAATICLHQAAMFKAEKHQLSQDVIGESKMRCLSSAAEIATIMKMVAHMDLTTMNSFLPFCLFVASRIFVQCIRLQPGEDNARSSVQFLLFAMAVLKQSNPMADSFLVQLELEVEGMGVQTPPRYPQFEVSTSPDDPLDGSPWVQITSPLVNIGDQVQK